MVLEQEGRGEKTMVINEFTSGKEDPKSGGGGRLVMKRLGSLSD